MIAATVEPEKWPRRQRWLMVALVMAGQLGLIFWLSQRDPVRHVPVPGANFHIPEERRAELPGLSDPTLFVLPNRHGFSGPAWLAVPLLQHPSLDWVEPPRWLPHEVTRLGGA